MTQGERVKEVRKELKLNLEQFGNRIGLKKNSLSQIENNKNGLTEQNKKAICREFNVNYSWLNSGEGDMFVETDDALLENLSRKYDLRDVEVSLIKEFIKLSQKDRDVLLNYLYNVFDQKKDE